jgi:hypothetical protein
MASTIEHPGIRFVSYPVHLDGTRTGAQPRKRHNPGCGHYDWEDGTIPGTPEPATGKQMETLPACKACIGSRGLSSRDSRSAAKEGRTGEVCSTCYQLMPLTGTCDNCAS